MTRLRLVCWWLKSGLQRRIHRFWLLLRMLRDHWTSLTLWLISFRAKRLIATAPVPHNMPLVKKTCQRVLHWRIELSVRFKEKLPFKVTCKLCRKEYKLTPTLIAHTLPPDNCAVFNHIHFSNKQTSTCKVFPPLIPHPGMKLLLIKSVASSTATWSCLRMPWTSMFTPNMCQLSSVKWKTTPMCLSICIEWLPTTL